jgi:hypothetical protein
LDNVDRKQACQFLQFAGNVTDSHCAVVRRTLAIPIVHELSGAAAEPIPAVGIPDFKNRAGFRFPFGHNELEPFGAILSYR